LALLHHRGQRSALTPRFAGSSKVRCAPIVEELQFRVDHTYGRLMLATGDQLEGFDLANVAEGGEKIERCGSVFGLFPGEIEARFDFLFVAQAERPSLPA
jgi:hypothetical protein